MKKYIFNDDWKNWIWSNIKDGISKQRIYDELIKNGYDVITVINELRFIPDIFRKRDEIPPDQVMDRLAKSGAKKIEVPIPFYLFENFITKIDCDNIIALQKKNNARSTIANKEDKRIDDTRTSYSTYFDLNSLEPNYDVVQKVRQKMLSVTGIPEHCAEMIQGQWYKAQGFYHNHYDACDDYNQFKNHAGNRTWTCMITLNEVEEGGNTFFPKLNMGFKPAIGQALIWYNLNSDGLAHPLTLHTGQAVKKGEKFILTQWFRQSRY